MCERPKGCLCTTNMGQCTSCATQHVVICIIAAGLCRAASEQESFLKIWPVQRNEGPEHSLVLCMHRMDGLQ